MEGGLRIFDFPISSFSSSFPFLSTPPAVSFLFLLVTGAMVKLIWSFLFGVLMTVTHMAFKPRSPGHRNSMNEEINLSSSNKIVSP